MVLESFRLDGKNALVTGSSRGLGAAIAIALAQAGANVGCHGRSADGKATSEQIRELGRSLSIWRATWPATSCRLT